MDIMTDNIRQFRLLFPLGFNGLAVYPVGGGENEVKEGVGEFVILARYRVHFIIEHRKVV